MAAASGLMVGGAVLGDDDGGTSTPTKAKSSAERCETEERPELDLRKDADPIAAIRRQMDDECFSAAELPKVPDLTTAQARVVIADVPERYRHAYAGAEAHGGKRVVCKEVLAAIGAVESDHGRRTPDGAPWEAEGPMQVSPETASGIGRGDADLDDIKVAAEVAADFLQRAGTANGTQAYDEQRAVFAYDHSMTYEKSVEVLAEVYTKAERALAAPHQNGPELSW